MSKIGKKELALREQRETKRPRGHVRLAKMVEDFPKAIREAAQDAKPSLKAAQAAKARAATFKAPSPKSQLVEALAAPKNGEIPPFLKRTETPEQAEARRKKQAKPDHSAGVTLAPPVSVQKAIEKELRDDDPPRKKKQTVEDVKQAARVEARKDFEKQEAKMAKKKPAKKAKAAAKSKNGGVSLTQKAREALMTKAGATRDELMKLTGWKAINIKKLVPTDKKLKQDKDHFRIV